ncbi:Retrovirus-related Pol polyprotein from transposon TNT 1-94 [Abeliophyllum distichum]|uniref:Retrovirus-related Pol polyprotein from transposon TNT 1-94 n=1 Tax=Abeliophyllum distichum TaxID=126358 RepID=A0ABD1PFC8_9LAMI
MESRSELCIFVGYPKGRRGYYFYSPQDKKVFVSTNATFLEDRYIEERESKSKVLLEEMKGNIPSSSTPEIRTEPTQHEFTPLPLMIPRCSGREMEVPPTIPTGLEAPDMSGDQVPPVQSPHETEPATEGHGGGETTLEQSQIPINQELLQLRRSERVI